jgi:hypothetical protein
MSSSGMLRRATLIRTDVSEEHIASIIRISRIGELATTLTETSNRRTLRRNTMTVHARTTRRNIPKDDILRSHRHENLKSYIALTSVALYQKRNVFPLRYELISYLTSNLTKISHNLLF